MQRKLAGFIAWWILRYSCSYIRFAEGPVQQWTLGPCCVRGFSTCRITCNRLCMISWSVLLSHVPHTCGQSGGTEERFLRLQNDRWLAGELFPSLPLCHDISLSAHMETAKFAKTNIVLSRSLCVLFLRKVHYRILSEIYIYINIISLF